MKPGGVAHQIIGSFEDIGKTVVEEAAKVPTQVVDTAMESLGVKTSKLSTQQSQTVSYGEGKPKDPNSPYEKIDTTNDIAVKKVIARAALEQLSGVNKAPKEPSVYETQNREAEEKLEREKRMKELQGNMTLPQTGSKRKRGDLYGVGAKQTKAERKQTGAD